MQPLQKYAALEQEKTFLIIPRGKLEKFINSLQWHTDEMRCLYLQCVAGREQLWSGASVPMGKYAASKALNVFILVQIRLDLMILQSPHPEEVLKASFPLFHVYFLSIKRSLQCLSESLQECDTGTEKMWKSIRGKAPTSERLVVGVKKSWRLPCTLHAWDRRIACHIM